MSTNLTIVDLLFLHDSYFFMAFNMLFWRNGKKGKKDASTIGRL
jgi:hypothetical protein